MVKQSNHSSKKKNHVEQVHHRISQANLSKYIDDEDDWQNYLTFGSNSKKSQYKVEHIKNIITNFLRNFFRNKDIIHKVSLKDEIILMVEHMDIPQRIKKLLILRLNQLAKIGNYFTYYKFMFFLRRQIQQYEQLMQIWILIDDRMCQRRQKGQIWTKITNQAIQNIGKIYQCTNYTLAKQFLNQCFYHKQSSSLKKLLKDLAKNKKHYFASEQQPKNHQNS